MIAPRPTRRRWLSSTPRGHDALTGALRCRARRACLLALLALLALAAAAPAALAAQAKQAPRMAKATAQQQATQIMQQFANHSFEAGQWDHVDPDGTFVDCKRINRSTVGCTVHVMLWSWWDMADCDGATPNR